MRKFYLPHALPNEKIILLIRRHWFVLFIRLMLWAAIGLIPIALGLLLPGDLQRAAESTVGYALLALGISLYYLYLWLFIFNAFVDYYLDVWIVTNERIINIEQRGLFSRIAAEQRLSRIQDVAAETVGFWPTFLRYGEVRIQTAGEKERFNFRQVPEPNDIARKISSLAQLKRHYEQVKEEHDQLQ